MLDLRRSRCVQQQDDIMTSAAPHTRQNRELISFIIGDQQFCVDIMAVRETRGWSQATPLPHAPDYVQGMIKPRGTVLPVVDLRARLGITSGELPPRRVIIVVWIGSRLVGLAVDAVSDTLTIGEDAVQPTPDVTAAELKSF